jgi:hypothetical protein
MPVLGIMDEATRRLCFVVRYSVDSSLLKMFI